MYECVRKLGEIASPKGGSGFPKKYQGKKEGQYPFFKVSDMNLAGNEIYMNHAANYVDDADLAAMKAKVYPAGTIVFPKIGGAISTNKKRLLTCDAIFDNNVMGVVPNAGISSEYIYKFFVSLDLYDLSNKAALPSITAGSVSELEIPLPPIPEQQRIVAILDQAFANIEKARANAEKNLKNARELFDSYLNQVFSQRGEGWKTKTLGDVADFSQGIQVGLKEQKTNIEPGYVRFIRIVDYTQNTKDIRYIKDPGEKYKVQRDDIVMVRYGTPGLIGQGKEGVIANNLFRIKINDPLLINDYLVRYLSQSHIQKYLSTQGSSTMPALSFGQLRKVKVDFPPIPEQQHIVASLDKLSMEVQQLKKGYQQKLNSLDELKQSLLQKAFSGELTKTEGQAA